MLIKLLLKIWPALLPWAIYFFWIFFSKKILPILRKIFSSNKSQKQGFSYQKNDERIIDAEYVSSDDLSNQSKDGKRSQNSRKANEQIPFTSTKHFIILLYLSLILAIISVISFAF